MNVSLLPLKKVIKLIHTGHDDEDSCVYNAAARKCKYITIPLKLNKKRY